MRQPIDILAVPEELRSRAIELDQDLQKCRKEFQEIRSRLTIEQIEPELENWVSALISLREDGKTYLEEWEKIRQDTQKFRNNLNQTAQKLHNAVNPLLEDGTFSSPRDIIECLEELYRLQAQV